MLTASKRNPNCACLYKSINNWLIIEGLIKLKESFNILLRGQLQQDQLSMSQSMQLKAYSSKMAKTVRKGSRKEFLQARQLELEQNRRIKNSKANQTVIQKLSEKTVALQNSNPEGQFLGRKSNKIQQFLPIKSSVHGKIANRQQKFQKETIKGIFDNLNSHQRNNYLQKSAQVGLDHVLSSYEKIQREKADLLNINIRVNQDNPPKCAQKNQFTTLKKNFDLKQKSKPKYEISIENRKNSQSLASHSMTIKRKIERYLTQENMSSTFLRCSKQFSSSKQPTIKPKKDQTELKDEESCTHNRQENERERLVQKIRYGQELEAVKELGQVINNINQRSKAQSIYQSLGSRNPEGGSLKDLKRKLNYSLMQKNRRRKQVEEKLLMRKKSELIRTKKQNIESNQSKQQESTLYERLIIPSLNKSCHLSSELNECKQSFKNMDSVQKKRNDKNSTTPLLKEKKIYFLRSEINQRCQGQENEEPRPAERYQNDGSFVAVIDSTHKNPIYDFFKHSFGQSLPLNPRAETEPFSREEEIDSPEWKMHQNSCLFGRTIKQNPFATKNTLYRKNMAERKCLVNGSSIKQSQESKETNQDFSSKQSVLKFMKEQKLLPCNAQLLLGPSVKYEKNSPSNRHLNQSLQVRSSEQNQTNLSGTNKLHATNHQNVEAKDHRKYKEEMPSGEENIVIEPWDRHLRNKAHHQSDSKIQSIDYQYHSQRRRSNNQSRAKSQSNPEDSDQQQNLLPKQQSHQQQL